MDTATTTRLTEKQQHEGMRLVYLGQSFGAILFQMLTKSAFGVLLIKHLGGSDFQAMLLGSLVLLPYILQIPTSLLIHPSAGKRFMLCCWFGNTVVFAAALGMTFLPIDAKTKVVLVLVLFGTGAAMNTVGSTFWFPLLHDLVPNNERGRFFGRMRTVWSSTTFLAIIITGVFLGKNPQLWRYQVVLAVVIVLYFARIFFIARVPEGRSAAANNDYANWKHYIRQILSQREVLIFCGYFSLLAWCVGFLNTPLVLYMRHMGFVVRENMIIFGFSMLGQALSLLIAGVLTDRVGTKRVFAAAHIVLCAVSFSVVRIGWLPPGHAGYLMPIAMIISGGMVAMAGIACVTQLFHLAPDSGRAFFMSFAIILMIAGTALSPMVAGFICQSVTETWSVSFFGIGFDIFQVMLSAAGIGMLILLILLFFVKDVRPENLGS